jgi:indoleacetamide hydrolase
MTDHSQLLDLPAAELATLIRQRRTTAVACAEEFIARADEWKALNAFVTLRPAQLLEDARRIDEAVAAGHPVGPLTGVPIVVKDVINTAAYPTTSGTPGLHAFQPGENAPVIERLLAAGAIIGGKANLHELAYGITSNNQATGPVRNPYDLTMIPGGSSGGTAAALAAGVATIGLGTDTGGSMRIPAALCGVVGMRPTLNRWPAAGVLPVSRSRDVVGPFGRTVDDVALLDHVVTGEPPAQPIALDGVCLGVPRTTHWNDLDPETATVAEAALRKLHDAGVKLVDVDMQPILDLEADCGFPLVFFETAVDMASYLAEFGTGRTLEQMVQEIAGPDVKDMVGNPPAVPGDDYRRAMLVRAAMKCAYAELWRRENIQGIVFPTTPLPARPIGQDETVDLNGREVPTFLTYIRNTNAASIAEIPGISLPIGLTGSGLPVGLEIDGPTWQDRTVLGLGMSIAQLFDRLPLPKLP